MSTVHELTPELSARLQKALVASFDQSGLLQFATNRLSFGDVNFADEVDFAQPRSKIAFQIVEVAKQNSRVGELVLALQQARPRRPDVAGLAAEFGLVPAVRAEAAGTPVPDVLTVTDGFEKTIRARLPTFDFAVWREKMGQVEGRICAVEIDGNAAGTGFLVGPDAVLTNYHVLASVLERATSPSRVTCRFDYKVLSDGTRMRTTDVGLHASDWDLDSSPPSAAEKTRTPDVPPPNPDELDYALVRLERAVGAEPPLSQVGAGASARGWIAIPMAAPVFLPKAPLLIAQHPDGKPLKFSVDTEAVLGVNANRTRVRYTNNTEPGSSGSPVFDLDWNLVALHHLGDPAYDHPPSYNQGVIIDPIRRRVERSGRGDALGR
jgi:hypothetical protein